MHRISTFTRQIVALGVAVAIEIYAALPAAAADVSDGAISRVGDTGASGIWILANISYAGMRAQGNRNSGWRILAFIFGFPGTLLSFIAVDENSERAYGIDLPRKDSRWGSGDGASARGPVVL